MPVAIIDTGLSPWLKYQAVTNQMKPTLRTDQISHLIDGVFGPEEKLRDRHGDGNGRLLQQDDHGGVVDVVHREHAHDARDAVQEPHHGELELRDGPLCRRNGGPDAITSRNITLHHITSHGITS